MAIELRSEGTARARSLSSHQLLQTSPKAHVQQILLGWARSCNRHCHYHRMRAILAEPILSCLIRRIVPSLLSKLTARNHTVSSDLFTPPSPSSRYRRLSLGPLTFGMLQKSYWCPTVFLVPSIVSPLQSRQFVHSSSLSLVLQCAWFWSSFQGEAKVRLPAC